MDSFVDLLAQIRDLNATKNFKKVIELLPEAVLEKYQNADLYAEKAQAHWRRRQFKLCEVSAKKAILLNPVTAKAYHYLGNYCYVVLKNYDAAIEAYQSAIDNEANYPTPHYRLGVIFARLKQYHKAIEEFKKAITIAYNFPRAHYELGNTYSKLKQYDKAIEAYQNASSIEEDLPNLHYRMGIIYARVKEYDKSIYQFKKAIEQNPEDPDPYNGLGVVYSDINQNEKAIDAYSQALSLTQDNLIALYNRAVVLFDLKKYHEALKDYKKYLELTKDSPDYYTVLAKSRINELQSILKDPVGRIINDLINKIKSLLLFEGETITHYTGLTTTRDLILNMSLFRISEGAYLNDTSEGRELYKYLDYHVTSRREDDTVAELFVKKPFIGSFVTEKNHDDLTLWRMYGKEAKEEAKGCALTVLKDTFLKKLKNNLVQASKIETSSKLAEEFKFYRVAYRRDDQKDKFIIPGAKDSEESFNRCMIELKDKLRAIKKKKSKKNIENQEFVAGLLNEIAYLFKSADYQYENEIRLVTKGLGLNKIISLDRTPPRVFIELIPLASTIKKITIGPKVDRPDEWASAFFYHFEKSKLNSPEILISHLPYK